ncbi:MULTISPECIES: sensor histidine kinase [Bacillaceae]|uniref:sensor histidine kinase n=1 Tax=Bacillaceae TaxID=186817 RepID=UPI002964158E|nr:histidine kinase [Bacillus infantis]MDW2879479.1 histidine kinase [Bacillus infantis]
MKSIRSRLFLMLLGFIIFPYFLLVIIIYTNTRSSVEDYEIGKSREELEKTRLNLEQYFTEIINWPYSLYSEPEVLRVFEQGSQDRQAFHSFQESLKLISAARPEVRQLRFYFHQSREALTVYRSKLSAPKVRTSYLEEGPFQRLYLSRENYLIEQPGPIRNYNNAAIIPESDHTEVITVHHKVSNVLSGEFLGFLSMDIDVSSYSPLISSLSNTSGATVTLSDQEGRMMYASNFGTRQASEDDGKMVLSESLGEPLAGWRLSKSLSKEVLFMDAKKTALTNIWLGLGVGMLGIVMILVISHIITKPIIRLSEKVSAIEGGGIYVNLLTPRKDEIGHLEVHINEMLSRIQTHINREYKLEIESRKNQFQALKSQVNPHFLFNALQMIGAVALQSDAGQVYKLIISLSKMMRYSLGAGQWVYLREEMNYIEDYLTLQKERFGDDLHASIEADEEILSARIPSMILQPLVENYFKHSYEEGCQRGALLVKGESKGSAIQLTVQNTGASISQEKLRQLRKAISGSEIPDLHTEKESDGIGLKNIHDRLKLNYEGKASFTIDTMNGEGFRVTMLIPFLQSQREEER